MPASPPPHASPGQGRPLRCLSHREFSHQDLLLLANHFAMISQPMQVTAVTSGLINNTYMITCHNNVRYILQRLNPQVFVQPEAVMDNLTKICSHAAKKNLAACGLQAFLEIIPTRQGQTHYRGEDGLWRCFSYIPNSGPALPGQTNFQGAGLMVGGFHRLMSDFPGTDLALTLPDFHHPHRRLEAYEAALSRAPADRLCQAQGARQQEARRRNEALAQFTDITGQSPVRIAHNDTSLKNILFDLTTNAPLTIIDLDTVMPGFLPFDFGDALRDCFKYSRSDLAADLAAFIEGFFQAAAGLVTQGEKKHLLAGARYLAYELGLRYLTDYFSGDSYFGALRPGENLDKALQQLALLDYFDRQGQVLQALILQQ